MVGEGKKEGISYVSITPKDQVNLTRSELFKLFFKKYKIGNLKKIN